MARTRHDDSVSPTTRSPDNSSPAPNESQPLPPPPKDAASLLPPFSFTPGFGGLDRDDKAEPTQDGRASAPRSNLTNEIETNGQANGQANETRESENGDPSATGNYSTVQGQESGGGRSIQFARFDPPDFQPGHSRHGSWDGPETPGKSRGGSIMSKLKSFTATSGSQSPKASTAPSVVQDASIQASVASPSTPHFGGSRLPHALQEEQSDDDADVEENADEGNATGSSPPGKKKRRMRRFIKGDISSPNSPAPFQGEPEPSSPYNRFLRRRASMPDTSVGDHILSEGEAKEQVRRRPFARRGHSWMHATTVPPGEEVDGMESSAVVGRRNGHARRITVFGGGGMSDGDAITPRRPFFHSERASTFGAQKWKQVKSTLKMLRQKKEDRFEYFKSAELMAELRAGAPAVLMLASMIQRDEHGNKRIPVLLEQLKLRITDSAPMLDDVKERHWNFTMELEYGSGPSRMVWTITRTIRDIYNLHFRYKFALNNDKYKLGRDLGARPKQPKFPYSAFPYLRGARNKDDSSEEEEQPTDREDTMDGGDATGDDTGDMRESREHGQAEGGEGHRQHRRKRSKVNMLGIRRRSTGLGDSDSIRNADGQADLSAEAMRQRYVDKQRRILEKYLSEMVRWLMFRADSNRLCRFLELSALGVRLAAEGSYHGKEGYLHIQSSKGLDFRRVLTPAKVIARHSRKWFLVRQSYIVCVDSPENMNIYDVYLVDSKFSIVSKRSTLKQIASKSKQSEIDLTVESPPDKHHTLTLQTSERKVRLFSRYQSVMKQFEESMTEMLRQTVWYEKKRFDSFAPVRNNVFAQWLVDGRDYMWNVSRAINMAKDVIYIHDWWLSPELYMRRPAAISQKWRLDRLLQKKAREGVKIFVIVYRNVEAAIPIDSEYTKFSLLNLHPNIFVQRSPNQFKKNQFFFAHHEKICVVDHDVAFLGGVDLCFGRWDCPQHPIVDDKPTGFELTEAPKDSEHCQLFPGKDYSNPRVQDFFRLNEPYEEMYDRSKVPRMPWHDVAMQVVGQPARDLTRHFVQRWNYLRRGRKSTRPLPFLLPPPEAKMDELEALGLTGTCEVQMLRSATTWSLGLEETEHSIQTAYVKMIEESDHFVYMENQFFISSTEVYNTKIANRIGDALVNRIVRAHENGETWRCVIVIPLMPGFQNTVDEQEGTSVRLILMCQYRSICRGEHSIFGRLRAAGIDPSTYIDFFSLRQWGIMSNDVLVTEQLYIHAKTIIVDDRIALIGSANINERSMLGSRDSECAAIVRDTDMIWSTMGGEPYQVGRFAHTLRMRLMREHLGLDVDEILEQERQQEMERDEFEQRLDEIYSEDPMLADESRRSSRPAKGSGSDNRGHSFNHELDINMARAVADIDSSSSSSSSNSTDKKGKRRQSNLQHDSERYANDVSGYGVDHWKSAEDAGIAGGRDTAIVNGREVLVSDVSAEGKGTIEHPRSEPQQTSPNPDNRYLEPVAVGSESLPPVPPLDRRTTEQLGLPRSAQLPTLPILDDTDIGGPSVHIDPQTGRPKSGAFHPLAADIKLADINKDCMRDPVNSIFIDDIWNRVARNNTKLYRRVFRCMPDSEVSTWAEYREFVEYGKRFKESMDGKPATDENELKREASPRHASQSGAIGVAAPTLEGIAQAAGHDPTLPDEKLTENIIVPGESGDQEGKQSISNEKHAEDENQGDLDNLSQAQSNTDAQKLSGEKTRERKTTFTNLEKRPSKEPTTSTPGPVDSVKRRRRATTKGSKRWSIGEEMPSRADAEELLKMVQGNVVQFPYDWLLTEENNGNWGYQVDGVAPLAIYN